jgi:hypothetical protein
MIAERAGAETADRRPSIARGQGNRGRRGGSRRRERRGPNPARAKRDRVSRGNERRARTCRASETRGTSLEEPRGERTRKARAPCARRGRRRGFRARSTSASRRLQGARRRPRPRGAHRAPRPRGAHRAPRLRGARRGPRAARGGGPTGRDWGAGGAVFAPGLGAKAPPQARTPDEAEPSPDPPRSGRSRLGAGPRGPPQRVRRRPPALIAPQGSCRAG